jgi:hypothetical protein
VCNDEEKAPHFQPALNIRLLDQEKLKAAGSLAQAHVAIQNADVSALNINLGPQLYKERQLFNQRANQLRWSWLEARTKVDLYQQAIEIVTLFARKYHCDRYIQQYLKDELNTFSRFEQAEATRLKKVMDGYPSILKIYEKDGLFAYAAIMEKLEPYATVYKRSYADVKTIPQISLLDYFQMWKLRRFIKVSLRKLPQETMNHTLKKFTETYQLTFAEQKAGEEKVSVALYRDSEGNVLTAIPSHTLSVIEKQVQASGFKNSEMLQSAEDEIDTVFSSVNNFFYLFNELRKKKYIYSTQCDELIVEYYANIADLKEKTRKLTEEFGGQAQPKDVEEILSSRTGWVSLGSLQLTYTCQDEKNVETEQKAKDLLRFAFNQYNGKKNESVDEKNKKYLPILVSLIERGYSPFTLQSENQNLIIEPIFTNNSWHWQILIAALDIMNCITPFAEEVRKILLDYAKKAAQNEYAENSRDDIIKQARCSAVTRLTKKLHTSQQPGTFQEAELIAEIRSQIAPGAEPRGLLGRSTLYAELGKLMARADSKAVLTIPATSPRMFQPAPLKGRSQEDKREQPPQSLRHVP